MLNEAVEIVDLLSFISELKEPEVQFQGKGIITCVTSRYLSYFTKLYHSLLAIGCKLPIEAWYRYGELTPEEISNLRNRGIECKQIDVHAKFNCGYAVKSYALVHTRFEECIFLDADNFVIKNPEDFFKTTEYQETGVLLWEDIDTHLSDLRRYPLLRATLNLPESYKQVEAGQMVWNRKKHIRTLIIANEMNQKGDFFYQYMWYDPQTFQIALELTNMPGSYIPRKGILFHKIPAIINFDTFGQAAFIHRAEGVKKWEKAVDISVGLATAMSLNSPLPSPA